MLPFWKAHFLLITTSRRLQHKVLMNMNLLTNIFSWSWLEMTTLLSICTCFKNEIRSRIWECSAKSFTATETTAGCFCVVFLCDIMVDLAFKLQTASKNVSINALLICVRVGNALKCQVEYVLLSEHSRGNIACHVILLSPTLSYLPPPSVICIAEYVKCPWYFSRGLFLQNACIHFY